MAENNTSNIGFEKQIWDAACVLRGNIDASEYKSVVLGLIFLKYITYMGYCSQSGFSLLSSICFLKASASASVAGHTQFSHIVGTAQLSQLVGRESSRSRKRKSCLSPSATQYFGFVIGKSLLIAVSQLSLPSIRLQFSFWMYSDFRICVSSFVGRGFVIRSTGSQIHPPRLLPDRAETAANRFCYKIGGASQFPAAERSAVPLP